MKNINLHLQEVQLTPSRVNTKRSISIHIIIKILNRKILKSAKEKQFLTFKKTPICLTADYLQKQWKPETLEK